MLSVTRLLPSKAPPSRRSRLPGGTDTDTAATNYTARSNMLAAATAGDVERSDRAIAAEARAGDEKARKSYQSAWQNQIGRKGED